MLTSPKLIVPDQKGRVPRSCAVSSCSCFLRNLLLLLHCSEALRQLLIERGFRLALLDHRQTWMFALGFRVKELLKTVAILVTKLFRIECPRERFDELLGHVQLVLRESASPWS